MRRLLLPVDFFVILFAVSAVLGTLTAYDRPLAYNFLIPILASMILYFITSHLIMSSRSARRIGVALLAAAVFVALVFILQFDYQNYAHTPNLIRRLGRFTTRLPNLNMTMPHPNAVATFLEGLVPMGFMLLVSRHRLRVRLIGLVSLLIIFYALLLTFSRGAFIAIVIVVVIAVSLRSPIVGIFVGLCVAILAISFLSIENLRHLNFIEDALYWASQRLVLYQNSLYVASDYLVTGIGLGSGFAMVYSRYGLLIPVPFLTYTHNLALAVWMGQGLLGLVALVGLVASFYLFIFRVMRVSFPRKVFFGAWMGVTAMLIHGLSDAREFVEIGWLMPTLFLLIGLTMAAGRLAMSESSNQEIAAHPSRFRFAPALVVLVLLIGGAVIFNRQLSAAWNTNLGALQETEGELAPDLSNEQRLAYYESARSYYRDALAADENWSNANRRLGNLNVKLEDFGDSVSFLERAFAREPVNPAAIKGLGLAYTWVGRIDDAARTFNLMPDPPGMAEELDVWGFYRSQEGDDLLSAYAYETSLALRGDVVSIPAWMRLGGAYLLAQRLDDARRWYERVLEVEPNNADARRVLEEIGN
jgi:cytochrome c-type biogenesis protein CcmH/NrfG